MWIHTQHIQTVFHLCLCSWVCTCRSLFAFEFLRVCVCVLGGPWEWISRSWCMWVSRGCPLACLRRQKNSSMIKRLWPCFRSCLQPQTRHCRQMVGGKEGENGDRESETIKRAELMSKNKRDIYQRLKRLAIIRYLSFSFSSSSRTPQCGWLFPTCPLFSLHLHLQNFNLPQPSFPFFLTSISHSYTWLSFPSLPPSHPPLLFQLPGGVWAEPHTSQLSSVGERSSWELSSKRWILKCSSPPPPLPCYNTYPSPFFPIPVLIISLSHPVSFSLSFPPSRCSSVTLCFFALQATSRRCVCTAEVCHITFCRLTVFAQSYFCHVCFFKIIVINTIINGFMKLRISHKERGEGVILKLLFHVLLPHQSMHYQEKQHLFRCTSLPIEKTS